MKHKFTALLAAILITLGGNAKASARTVNDPGMDYPGSGRFVDYDILTVTDTISPGYLNFSINLNREPVLSGLMGYAANNQLCGFLGLDTDQNSATGAHQVSSYGSDGHSSLGLGIDYNIPFCMFTPGQLPNSGTFGLLKIESTPWGDWGNTIGDVPGSWNNTRLNISIPLDIIADNGLTDYIVIAGNSPYQENKHCQISSGLEITDVAVATVPEPASLSLLASGLGALIGLGRKKRTTSN
ncbi:MAG: PEP-CTERM sorting domain-containing protein [Candidatus Schekmanbacteria bacterium]|nr:PEP-CTERM sorting domain-containing protein [Candidatus Schekmanbacteria bacterium]